MLSLVLIKNSYSFVYLIVILSNKLDLNEETHFPIKFKKIKKIAQQVIFFIFQYEWIRIMWNSAFSGLDKLGSYPLQHHE